MPPGSGRRTLSVIIGQSPHSSLVLGLFGADWFYLSCGDAIFISIGLNKLLASSIAILLLCHMSGWCVVYLSYQTYKKLAGTFHIKQIKKLCLLFSGSGSTLEVRKSILPFSSSLSVRKFFHFIFLTIRPHTVTQVATSWPSLGGGSTTPGSPLDTGRGFYEF